MEIVNGGTNQLVSELLGFRSWQIASTWITHNASYGFGFGVIDIYTGQDPLAIPISKITLQGLQGLAPLLCFLFLIVFARIEKPRPTFQLLV
jgi:hypothetical protein